MIHADDIDEAARSPTFTRAGAGHDARVWKAANDELGICSDCVVAFANIHAPGEESAFVTGFALGVIAARQELAQ